MRTTVLLKSCGHELSADPAHWGLLRESSDVRHDAKALRNRMEEDGYLFIRDFFPRELIRRGRMGILEALRDAGNLFEGPPEEGILAGAGRLHPVDEGVTRRIPAVRDIVFDTGLFRFYEQLLEHPVRAFDFIWLRTRGAGLGTYPHCDLVYMGRGTHRLYTAWIPYGDISFEIGGLMVLEKSHLHAEKLRNYLELDVDTYCENDPDRHGWKRGGHLTMNPASLRDKLGGRWLSAEFRMGDLLTFRMDTVHGSLDNQTRSVRLSTDTRYQRADEPADERWIGENPIAHGPDSKRALIC